MSTQTELPIDETPAVQTFAKDYPHRVRAKEILADHPEVRDLVGRNPWSGLIVFSVVTIQIVLASLLSSQPWWLIVLVAYVFGSLANHSLYVMIHEATHDRIFKRRRWNMIAGIVSDIPNVLPAYVSFKTYHLRHHAEMNVYDQDADVPNHWERKLFGNNPISKALWLFLFPVFQITRPPRLKSIRFMSWWTLVNWVVVFGVDAAVFFLLGPKALLYLACSFFFSIGGLNPLSARWIQEHFMVNPPQETYSYYGPVNKVNFNIGHHNEHHDFPSVPWNKLPELRRIASEYYDTLYFHRSYTKLLLRFVFDPRVSLDSRKERVPTRSGPGSAEVA